MLEYYKLILTKVSFNKELFEKELNKAVKMLSPNENANLEKWCLTKFRNPYQRTIENVFLRNKIPDFNYKKHNDIAQGVM
ncbi:hypothetical protein [Flexithrix dorotheae]|uniref:hypothetical protein n=1 Tax=Flexithrix dorotheae TaxID=70993 RepID=UPI00035EA72A|nr:hypothetical protein [Flexithrix dorotheae]